MKNLIVDEGNTLCKIAVLDKSEVLFEWSAGEFDMAKAVERKDEVLAQLRGGIEFLLGHVAHLLVSLGREDFPRFRDVGEERAVSACGLHELAEVLVFLGKPYVALHVGDYRRIGDERTYFFETRLDSVEARHQ